MQMTQETLVGWVIKYITVQEFLGIKFMVINKNKYTQVIKKILLSFIKSDDWSNDQFKSLLVNFEDVFEQ